MKVRRTPYFRVRMGDPKRDVDLAGNYVPPDHYVFVKTDDCAFQGVDKEGKKLYYAGDAPQGLVLRYESIRHGWTDWKCDKGMRTHRWFTYMYCLVDGIVCVGKQYAIAPPEIWRERAFAEKGIVVSPTGQIVK